MADKEATARIKINKLLEEAEWRFLDDENGQANIQLEPNVKITESDIDDFGQNFETTKNGFVDFLLLDEKNFSNKHYGQLNFYPAFSMDEFSALNGWRDIVPEYAKDYIPFNTYAV